MPGAQGLKRRNKCHSLKLRLFRLPSSCRAVRSQLKCWHRLPRSPKCVNGMIWNDANENKTRIRPRSLKKIFVEHAGGLCELSCLVRDCSIFEDMMPTKEKTMASPSTATKAPPLRCTSLARKKRHIFGLNSSEGRHQKTAAIFLLQAIYDPRTDAVSITLSPWTLLPVIPPKKRLVFFFFARAPLRFALIGPMFIQEKTIKKNLLPPSLLFLQMRHSHHTQLRCTNFTVHHQGTASTVKLSPISHQWDSFSHGQRLVLLCAGRISTDSTSSECSFLGW